MHTADKSIDEQEKIDHVRERNLEVLFCCHIFIVRIDEYPYETIEHYYYYYIFTLATKIVQIV